jgi:hypothetical protein
MDDFSVVKALPLPPVPTQEEIEVLYRQGRELLAGEHGVINSVPIGLGFLREATSFGHSGSKFHSRGGSLE